MAFGERRSPATSLRMALRAHGFLARRGCERTGFSPGAPTFYCVRAASAGLLLRAPEKCKESVFEPPILLQNQANPQILLQF